MTESVEHLMTNGADFSAPASLPSSGGFDAYGGWDSAYNLRLPNGEGVGKIPMPSQTKIDNFQRTVAKLLIELDAAGKKESEARADETKSVEERMAEVEEALKLKREVMGKFCDALALVCSNQPTRTQLGKLNEPQLFRFVEFVGGLLNPNV